MIPGRIPLLPLEVVLFPGSPLPLHIFEPRYKLMIGRCLAGRQQFGVILARASGIAPVGCAAEILEVVRKYPDGRMDILTVGRGAYRVREVFEDEPYLVGDVEFLEEERAEPRAAIQKKLRNLFEQCHALIYGRTPDSRSEPVQPSLAFEIAAELPLELDFKQELLELRSETERQERLLERLTRWRPELAHLARVRAKAGGNGQGGR